MPRRKDQVTVKLPIRVYSFYATIVDEPVAAGEKTNTEKALEIVRTAHVYKNKLIEIERARRERVDAVLRQLSPQLVTVDTQIKTLTERIDAIYDSVRAANIKKRKRVMEPEAQAQVDALKAERKALFVKRGEIRKPLFKLPEFKVLASPIDSEFKQLRLTARAACGVYHGTYQLIEQACENIGKGAPPEFKRFEGRGGLGVQIRDELPVPEMAGVLVSGNPASKLKRLRSDYINRDTMIQLDSVTTGVTAGRIRIGTVAGSAQPIWLPFSCLLHRDIPADALVKYATLQCQRIATKYVWSFQLTLARKCGWDDPRRALDGGTVAIDLGWRRLDGVGLRVGYWADSHGDSGQIVIPEDRLARVAKVEDLASIRDKKFDAIIEHVRAWLAAASDVPQWLREDLATLLSWNNQGRLAAVVVKWRTSRFAGDDAIFATVEAWRKDDKHLYEWQENQRRSTFDWRQTFYREIAAQWRRKYRTVVIEDFDVSQVALKPEPTAADTEQNKLARRYRGIAGVSYLRSAICAGITAVVKVTKEQTALSTSMCNRCGVVNEFDRAKVIVHTCTGCGATWDRDYNAALNLLHFASGAVVS